MDGCNIATTGPDRLPAAQIRLFSVSGDNQVWAVWVSTEASDDLLGFVVTEDERQWSAQGLSENFTMIVRGFTCRRHAALYLGLTGGVRAKALDKIELPAAAAGSLARDERQTELRF